MLSILAVIFKDGTVLEDVDVIIYCTGYNITFPVLENNSLIQTVDNKVDLYKYIFDPRLSRQTLSIIGLVQPIGALMPISELQARLSCKVFKGDITLPSKADMYRSINEKQERMASRYYSSSRHTVQVCTSNRLLPPSMIVSEIYFQ